MTDQATYVTLAPPLLRAVPTMGYIKLSRGVELTPSQKIITQNTVDLFLLKVQEGFTLSAAGRALSLSQAQLKELLQKHVLETQLKEAMRIGAEVLIDEASEAIRTASNREEIDQAKALAQHYRWLAAKLNAKMYGDAIKVDGNIAPSYEFIVNIPQLAPTEKLINGKTPNVIEHTG